MLRFGEEPYLECSSKGDRRFSAFYAKFKEDNKDSMFYGKSIEDLYQGAKKFEDGSTGLSWKEAKGKKPVNAEECRVFYSKLWDKYMLEHPEFKEVLKEYNGFTDIFGQEGHACQAEEIYRIKKAWN